MKIAVVLAAVATVVSAGIATSMALASPQTLTPPRTLKVVMHDPGCHWFHINSTFRKSATATRAARIVNFDEAALKVASSSGVRRIPVGKSIVVGRGSYVITMVRQAPDDNHLKLTVR